MFPRLFFLATFFLFVSGWFVANLDKRPELRAVAHRPEFAGAMSLTSALFVVLLALPSFIALVRWTGWKHGLLVLAAMSVFAIAVETLALKTGFPYGRFQYGAKIGGKLFGLVPWTVPFAWTPLTLGAMFLAARHSRMKWQKLWLSALWLVAFDVVLDPGAVAQQFWHYRPPGSFYGVPLSNFAGWLLSGFLGSWLFACLALNRQDDRQDEGDAAKVLPKGLLSSSFLILIFWTSVCLWSGLLVPAVAGALLSFFIGRLLSNAAPSFGSLQPPVSWTSELLQMRLLVLVVLLYAPVWARAQINPLAVAPLAAPAPSPTMFPFALPPFDSSKTATDMSWLNPAPAGSSGFIRAQGEHFVDGKGQVVRLWGVNLNFGGAFPDKTQAPLIAARLAKFGFNAARLHHYEGYAAPAGFWKPVLLGSNKPKIPRQFDPEQVDKFDFFVSELIRHGIYIDLNLHVGRKSLEGEGVLNAAQLPDKDKAVNAFDPRLIQLQQQFSRAILTHVNPYTRRALKDEPGLACVEADNESSLLGMWLDAGLTKFPNDQARMLRDNWNGWLQQHYTEDNLRAAWTETEEPLGTSDLMQMPPADAPIPEIKIVASRKPRLQKTSVPKTVLQKLDAPLFVAPTNPPIVNPPIQAALDSLNRLQLTAAGGAIGTIGVDVLSGPIVDGFVRPGLTAQLQVAGNVSWAFQLNRDGLDLIESKPYTLSFWARSDTARRISVNLWQDREPRRSEGFTAYADLTNYWQKFSFSFRPVNPDPNHSRLSWNIGNQTGTVQIGEIQLQTGGRIGAPLEWSLQSGIPLIDWKTAPVWAARRDFARFLGELEEGEAARTRDFLKREIGIKCPFWQTQGQFGGWAGLRRESNSDAIDMHAYWKHPDFGETGWNGTLWKVENAAMAAAPASDPLSAFSFGRLSGQPFIMTEWNSGQPNDFGGESLLMAASWAAWQDWAGVFLFDYHSSGDYSRDHFEGFFSIDSHPVKMATAPAAALLFRRPNGGGENGGGEVVNAARGGEVVNTSSSSSTSNSTTSNSATSPPHYLTTSLPGDLLPSWDETTLSLDPNSAWDEVADAPGGPSAYPFMKTWFGAGGWRGLPLSGRVSARFEDAAFPTVSRAGNSSLKEFVSDTQQVKWSGTNRVFSVNAPRSKVALGFLGGQGTNLAELQIEMPPSPSNFACFALSSLDGREVVQSKHLLLTVVGRAENIGMAWNAERNSVGNGWGTGPTQVEGIDANIRLLTDAKRLHVWALDETGARRALVPSALQNGALKFAPSAFWKTLWYKIEEW